MPRPLYFQSTGSSVGPRRENLVPVCIEPIFPAHPVCGPVTILTELPKLRNINALFKKTVKVKFELGETTEKQMLCDPKGQINLASRNGGSEHGTKLSSAPE